MIATNAEVLGEVALDPDGVLHGWCWSPGRPEERLTLDILVDDVVSATVVASRFREDIRNRKFGDGYHGFTITLTKQLSRLPAPGMVSARERASGRVFWQKFIGNLGLPPDFDARVAAVQAAIGDCAAWMPAPVAARRAMLAAGIGAAGATLRQRGGDRLVAPDTVTLPFAAAPALSLVLDGGADAARTRAIIAAAAETIGTANAELILIDHGADPANVLLASEIRNLRYFYDARSRVAVRRNMAAEICRGGTIVFLRNTGRRFDLGLKQFNAASGLIVAPRIAALAFRAWPEIEPLLTQVAGKPYLGLDIAIDRALFAACGGFDERMEDGDGFETADLLVRALDGRQALVWPEPRMADDVCHADGFIPLR